MTDQELIAELTDDPSSLGYAARLAIRDDGGIEALINDAAGPGAGTVANAYVTKGLMLLGLRNAALRLSDASDAVQRKWDRVLDGIHAVDGVLVDDATLAMFAAAVSDGITTADEVAAITHRPGSRAEVLWGAGTSVPVERISRVLNARAQES